MTPRLPHQDEQDRRKDDITVEGPFGIRARFRGLNVIVTLLTIAVTIGGTVLYFHLQDEHQVLIAIQQMQVALVEATYISTLPQAEKEQLHLNMPESLREKLIRNGGNQ